MSVATPRPVLEMVPPVTTIQTGAPILPRHGACLLCRKRKQRCDGAKPECQECLATNRKCQYEDDTYRTRTQQLRDRIKELETQIAVAQAARDAMHSADSSSRSSSCGRNHSSSDGSTPAFSDPSHVSPPTTASSPKDSVFSASDRPSPSPATTSYEPRVYPNLIQSGPSLDQTKRLLDTFSAHSSQCGFELHLGRVMRGLVPGAEEPIIPALLNVMLLMGCHFVDDPSLKFWESMLIPRIKHDLEDNIDNAHGMGVHHYNSLYHLQAMIMLGVYYYFKGRLLEGHVHITQAARFATVLGITRLNSRIFRQETTSNEPRRGFGVRLWHPRDPVELGEAINMWWTCSTWDLGGSTMNGLPVAVPFEEVTTVWPRPLSDFELGYTVPDDNYSAAALLDPELSYIVADTSGDCPQALLAKANILMQHASRIDTQRVTCPQELETWWTSFERCDYSLNRFMKTMPPVGLARNPGELAFYILIHNAIYCGQVQLHCVQAEYELALGAQGDPRCLRPDGTIGGISYTICTEACKAASLASTLSLDLDPAYMHMFSGIGWVCVSEVVVRDVPKLRRLGRIAEAEAKERQGEIMERCMEKLLGTYPVLALQAEQLRAKKKEHLLLFCGSV